MSKLLSVVIVCECRFVNSVKALKGGKGKDIEILAPVGITVTSDSGKIIGRFNLSCILFY